MKTSQKGFIVPLLLIIVAILLAGGGAYFYTQTKSEKPSATESVILLQATSTGQTSNSQITDWHIYHNTTYGFTLTFPDAWKGYRVQESTSTISFGIKDQDLIFRIALMTKQEWGNAQKETAEFGSPLPSVIGENSNYVFVSVSSQDFTNAVIDLARMRNSIISTFKLNP